MRPPERPRSEVIIEVERPTLWPDLSELTEADERCDGARMFPPEMEVSIQGKLGQRAVAEGGRRGGRRKRDAGGTHSFRDTASRW